MQDEEDGCNGAQSTSSPHAGTAVSAEIAHQLSECNIQGPLSHRGHKGTAEEGIRLRDIFLSSARYTNLIMLLPNKETPLEAL